MTRLPAADSADADPWALLRAATRARIGLGRAGDALPTSAVLDLAADHALARDAVHEVLDVAALQAQLGDLPHLVVPSAAPDRATYLQRPDLGRRLGPDVRLPRGRYDVVFVLADGLSARAVHAHAVPTLRAALAGLDGWSVGPVVVATQARVALGDEVGAALGADAVVVLLGERPGLSAPDSLGAYVTWAPRPGRLDSERNCVSNVRPPAGQSHEVAGATVARLLREMRRLGLSGVRLKDDDRGRLESPPA
ncbi:MAG: Ethanolamine ammonia-lyase [Frankiales bacterium]|nr:Ethanolamine ammonia-lyase [Frankiales bacterium]